MKNDKLINAIGKIDDDLILDADKDVENAVKPAPQRVYRRRVWLIAAAAAALILAVTVPMIIFFANKAPEPETPVVAVTTEETKEDEKTTVTETPVETKETEVVPTETQVEPTPTETPIVTPTPTETPIVTPTPVETETPIVTLTPTPTAQPTDTTTPTGDDSIGRLVLPDRDSLYWFEAAEIPYLAVRITEITDNQIYVGASDIPFSEIEYEVLCCSGIARNFTTESYESIKIEVSELMKNPRHLFIPDSHLDGLKSGDVIICGDILIRSVHSETVLDDNVILASAKEGSFVPIKDGVLFNRDPESGGTNILVYTYSSEFESLKNRYKNGFEVVNKELFERMPDITIKYGETTVEEFIEVMKWFEELKKVAVIKTETHGLYDSYEVIV